MKRLSRASFRPQARAMLDEADERWSTEPGLLADNPLLKEIKEIKEIEHAADLLRSTPEIGVVYRGGRFRREVRRLLLRSGWHLYYSFDLVAVVTEDPHP